MLRSLVKIGVRLCIAFYPITCYSHSKVIKIKHLVLAPLILVLILAVRLLKIEITFAIISKVSGIFQWIVGNIIYGMVHYSRFFSKVAINVSFYLMAKARRCRVQFRPKLTHIWSV